MSEVLSFIKIFYSPSNELLFKECACYWFSFILHERFPSSRIMYNPHLFHFATEIRGKLYDISGEIEDDDDYMDWEEYSSSSVDASMIIDCCIKLKGGEIDV